MKSSSHSMSSLACLVSLLMLAGCSEDLSAEQPATRATEEVATSLPPDRERLLERSREYWQHKQAGDWIQVFDFLSPQSKQVMPLGKFLVGKENHVYKGASDPLILKIKEGRGYVEIHVEWTPTHPILATVDNASGSMAQILDEVDEWQWSDGEWWLSKQHRMSELRKTHPQLWAK